MVKAEPGISRAASSSGRQTRSGAAKAIQSAGADAEEFVVLRGADRCGACRARGGDECRLFKRRLNGACQWCQANRKKCERAGVAVGRPRQDGSSQPRGSSGSRRGEEESEEDSQEEEGEEVEDVDEDDEKVGFFVSAFALF